MEDKPNSNGNIPTTNKELWVILKSLPYHLQIFVGIVLSASVINIPDGVYSLMSDGSFEEVVDSLGVRVSNLEFELRNHSENGARLVGRVDTLTSIILQNRESLDYLWCLNERADAPEVRTYCGELRDAVREALEIRAGVGR
jgi:hypothetical protein